MNTHLTARAGSVSTNIKSYIQIRDIVLNLKQNTRGVGFFSTLTLFDFFVTWNFLVNNQTNNNMTTAKPWTVRLFFLHALLAFIIGIALYLQNEQFLKLLSTKITSTHFQVIRNIKNNIGGASIF